MDSSSDEYIDSYEAFLEAPINEQIDEAIELQRVTPMSESDSSGSQSDSESCDFTTLGHIQEQKNTCANQEISSTQTPQLEKSDVWSDTEEIPHKYIESGHKKRVRKITFLNNKYKKKKGAAKIIGYKPPRSSKKNISLWNKYHILKEWHNSKLTLEDFKKQHRGAQSGWESEVRDITKRSWKTYRLNCGPGSGRMKQLAKYVKSHSMKHCKAKTRFRKNPDKACYGILPILGGGGGGGELK